jgi:hypothetical protein
MTPPLRKALVYRDRFAFDKAVELADNGLKLEALYEWIDILIMREGQSTEIAAQLSKKEDLLAGLEAESQLT